MEGAGFRRPCSLNASLTQRMISVDCARSALGESLIFCESVGLDRPWSGPTVDRDTEPLSTQSPSAPCVVLVHCCSGCPGCVHARHSSPTLESASPTPLVSASVHRDGLWNAEPVQCRAHLHCFGNGVQGDSVTPAGHQRRPLGSGFLLPRTPLPADPPRPWRTAPHPVTERFDDVAAKVRGSATAIRKVLNARLRCSGVQQREDFQLHRTCGIEDDHDGAWRMPVERRFVLTRVEASSAASRCFAASVGDSKIRIVWPASNK
jgi:hypothetical protein